jgi:hypothetical protein
VKIKEENLDRMIDFDNQLVDDIGKIVEEITVFKAEVARQDLTNAAAHVQHLGELLESFEGAFDGRQEAILGVN